MLTVLELVSVMIYVNSNKTRMTTFIKTKFKIFDLESPSNLQVKEKKIIKIGPETTKLDFCGQDSHLEKIQY